jgi:hypothetical protein
MRATRRTRRRRLAALGAVLFAAIAIVALAAPHGEGVSRAVAASSPGETTAQTDDSIPAREVTMFGASPKEAPNETWGIGRSQGATAVVRYSSESGWSLAPALQNAKGEPLSSFKLAQPEAGKYPTPSPLAGQTTPNGSGALLGTVPAPGSGIRRVLLIRDPGSAFKETAPIPSEAEAGAGETALRPGEQLFGIDQAPMLAALEEGSRAGALVVPVDEGGEHIEDSVLHWNGEQWTREPIEVPPASSEEFQVLAVGASSPSNAWLLARLSANYPAGSVELFRRIVGGGGETPTWKPVTVEPAGAGEPLRVPVEGGESAPLTVVSGTQSQVLTVTGEGVWIDGVRTDAQASTTIFIQPQGETSGHVVRAWCKLPASAPEGSKPCAGELPEALPSSGGRSYAWAGSSGGGLGERVITGLEEGVSMRLEGSEFRLIPALGGTPHQDVGGSYGAAFSNAHEGWLGQQLLPVHVTQSPIASRLSPWPVPFRKALLALAPQPGAPVGSHSSQALAVGDQGEVARYVPGSGWMPESLIGASGHHETPRLRAVAWPTPGRAYAVGDTGENGDQPMWLWRGETGLWEPDPATPPNFRGNLLGVAFDPTNPARGYAVGEGDVLLRYGKTWEQEPAHQSEGIGLPGEAPCSPREASNGEEARRCSSWADVSFTSIAFAGSEAIVAYRILLSTSSEQYRGGLIVNSGNGWHIDRGAAEALGPNTPYAVAALPDGGAAFSSSGLSEGSQIYERQSVGSSWQATPTPFPGQTAGALALFREGGALRVITSGSVPDTARLESEANTPPGFPPTLLKPYPVESRPEQGVLRQMASGWSDEEHELNNVKEPPGEYAFYDTVYQPDPVAAVMVNSSGSEGWAVGGNVSVHTPLDTADVERYPVDGSTPDGIESAPLRANSAEAAFAIGGNAQCEAPCQELEKARVGPDVWLSAALARAGQIAGARAFLYTGSRVTTGKTAGPATLAIPYRRELGRYAELLQGSPLPVYAAASPTDLDGAGSEASFVSAFSGFAQPFGESPPAPGLEPVGRSAETCATVAGCQTAYYAFSSKGSGGTVRVIVLDDSSSVDGAQLEWLTHELEQAKSAKEPAIAVGNADIGKLSAARVQWAASVAAELVEGGASAYFYDAREENVDLPLRSGANSIPSFGSGTLGYVQYNREEKEDFNGASGFLLTQVAVASRDPATNRAPVSVQLIPNIGELALEAEDGTLVRRSSTSLFEGLARRPRAGNRAPNGSTEVETDPYIPVPANCFGTTCATDLLPEYTFSSSRPEIGNFVEPNLATSATHDILLGPKGEPIPDPHSGVFCAFNAGTTIVTITAGGLSSSLPVTVQAGSVRQPCGTTKLNNLPSKEQAAVAPPAPAPAPSGAAPASSSPPVALPAPPPPPATATPPAPAVHAPVPAPFFVVQPLAAFVPAILPPPIPTPARPTPPSGTSAVTSPVEAPEKEEEQEAAPESVSNEAVAYRASEHEPPSAYLIGIIVLAALAGASVRGRPGRRGRGVTVAPATISSSRSQRRISSRRR